MPAVTDPAAARQPHTFALRLDVSLGVLWPALLVLPFLLLSLWMHAQIHQFTRVTDYIEIGLRYAPAFGVDSLATSPSGFDGECYYFMARFPGQFPPGGFDNPAKRYSRMLYPLSVRLASLGQAGLMPWMMIILNILAIVGAVYVISLLLKERGLPMWPALAVGLFCGQPLAMLRDLTDPLAVFWLAIALYGLHRGRWLVAAAALGFGMLTRESTLVFVVCLAVPLLVQRRWRMLAAYSAIALGPYLVWAVLVSLITGRTGLGESARESAFVLIPFSGLASAHNALTAIIMLIFAAVPTALAIALGLRALADRPWHDTFKLGVALAAVGYGIATALQPGVQWIDIWGPMRVVSPLGMLVALLAPTPSLRLSRLTWRAALQLMLISFAVVLIA